MVDDNVRRWWYNTKKGTISVSKPAEIKRVGKVSKVIPKKPAIFSRFEWPDGRVEYIEPLVSHLRHPLTICGDPNNTLVTDRSYIIPPPSINAPKAYYFDAGASSWSTGFGGPSLNYFTTIWRRHGIDFDHIEAWEGSTTPER